MYLPKQKRLSPRKLRKKTTKYNIHMSMTIFVVDIDDIVRTQLDDIHIDINIYKMHAQDKY